MNDPVSDWNFYRSFLAVVANGNLSAAAKSLGLTQPTVGRHISALEAALGAKLFVRSQQSLRPTDLAKKFLPFARTMSETNEAAQRALSGETGEPEGSVRLTASVTVGSEILPAMLVDFHQRHPRIAIELVLSNRNQDLLRGEADIAVRMARPTQEALIVQRLGNVALGLFAHRDYISRFGEPRTVFDLSNHTLIGFDRDDSAARLLGAGSLPVSNQMFALRTDDVHAQLAAVRAGFGIGVCHVAVALRDPDLVRILPAQVAFKLEMWLAMHEDLKNSRRVRLLYSHLSSSLKMYVSGKTKTKKMV
jgi:DNA-binding transcriptional LysR family regulator